MRRGFPALVLALGLATSCGRCRAPAGAAPERFLPADAVAAVVIPELARAARELAALHATVSEVPGATELAGVRAAVAAQLGLDPLDPAALERGGLDPERGAALGWLAPGPGAPEQGGAPLVVLPVSDPEAFDALVRRVAEERLGAKVRSEENGGGRALVVHRRAAGGPPVLAWAIAERTAVLVAGKGGPEAVSAALARTHATSLAGSAAFDRARRVLRDDAAVVLHSPPGSPAIPPGWPLRSGGALGLTGSGERLRAVLVLLPGGEGAPRGLDADGGGGDELARRVDPGAALVARFDGDPAALGKLVVPWVPARERARLSALGLDLQRDLFDQARPGAAGAISLNPGLRVQAISERALRADPLRAIRFAAAVPLRDPEAARAISARVARSPGPVWRIATPSGEFAWRIDGDRLAIAGGPPGELERFAGRLGGDGAPFRPPTALAADALEDGFAGATVHPGNLVAQVRALPPSAYGTGPSGFVLRSVVERFVEPAGRLAAVSLRAELVDGALRLALDVEARPPAGSAP